MSYRGGMRSRAQFAKGILPEWVEEPGTLMRATAYITKLTGESQVPGYMTVQATAYKPYSEPIAAPGNFGLYLGKQRVEQRVVRAGQKRLTSVVCPTFWFNGRRIVCIHLASYEDMVVSDDVYDDWRIHHSTP